MKQPVTIGGHTYIYDLTRGWIEKKTKVKADETLEKLLNSVSTELPDSFKNLRTKIDKSVEPISMAGEKYIYDLNKGWVNEKTKLPVPDHLQKILSDTAGVKPISSVSETFAKSEPAGMVGKSATDKLKKTKPEPKPKDKKPKPDKKESVGNINPLIVTMIHSIFAIDDLLKQKYKRDQSASRLSKVLSRENMIESSGGQNADSRAVEIAEEEGNGVSPILIASALGVIALAFDPIRDGIKGVFSALSGIVNGFTSTMKSANKGMTWFLNNTGGDPVNKPETSTSAEPKEKDASEKKTPDATPTETSKTPEHTRQQPSTTKRPPAQPAANVPAGSSRSGSRNRQQVTPVPPSTARGGTGENKKEQATPKQTKGEKITGKSSGFANPLDDLRMTSGFGPRKSPTAGASKYHKGLDFGAPKGTPVKAAASGIVTVAGTLRGYGNVVYIKHFDGTETRYAHLSAIQTNVGAQVEQGQIIGKVGNTGASTGPHLHFEVRKNGKAVDPRGFLNGAKNSQTISAKYEPHTDGHSETHTKTFKEKAEEALKKPFGWYMQKLSAGFSKIAQFDTTYKPFVQKDKDAAKNINTAAAQKQAMSVDLKFEKSRQAFKGLDMPNMNRYGGSVKTPSYSEDGMIVHQYLRYFDIEE